MIYDLECRANDIRCSSLFLSDFNKYEVVNECCYQNSFPSA